MRLRATQIKLLHPHTSSVSQDQILIKYRRFCYTHTALHICAFLHRLCTHKVFLHTLTHLVITLTMGGRCSYSSCIQLRVPRAWNREVLLPCEGHAPGSQGEAYSTGAAPVTNPCLWGPGGGAVGEGREPQGQWLGRLSWEGRWARAPASEKATVLAWAREKLRFLEMHISTFITVLSAKCKGGQRARDGSCYSWRNALLVKYEKCFRNEFPAMVWKQMLDSFVCFPPLT